MSNTHDYYASEYKFSLESDDDDQIYEVHEDESITYRTQHQCHVLLDSLQLPADASVLDFGCAKGLMAKWLRKLRPDLNLFLFDVTAMHQSRWKEIVPLSNSAVGTLPKEWNGRFNAVALMFVLEHVEDPVEVFKVVRRLLSPEGYIHGVVPDIESNFADLIVRDHVHHYSIDSLRSLLLQSGFINIVIDRNRHQAGLTFTAQIGRSTPTDRVKCLYEISESWTTRRDRIRKFEKDVDQNSVAIFGAGVNGTFVFGCLEDKSRVKYFIDNNPYLQGTLKFGCEIVSPANLPQNVQVVYSALNSNSAQSIISENLGHRTDLKICL